MLRFEPKNPDYRSVTFPPSAASRRSGTAERISIARLEPGEVDLSMPYSADFTQQNGFVHAGIITAGLDNACGIAAFTLMPEGSDILTVQFKTNLLAPGRRAARFAFRAHVVKPGRTLKVGAMRAHSRKSTAPKP